MSRRLRQTIADNPMALDPLQIKIPTQLPSDERKAAVGPPIIDWRKTIATPCPGTMTSSNVVKAKEGRLVISCDTY
jgi:hypothetical protein